MNRNLLLGRAATAGIAAALTVVAVSMTTVGASHEPANKVAASGSRSEVTFVEDGQTATLMSETVKTSSPTDLILGVTTECSIVSQLSVTGDSSSVAEGQLTVSVLVDGNAVPITSVEDPEAVGPTELLAPTHIPAEGEVVFCNQAYGYAQTVGTDDESDKVDTFLRTRQANAFQWLALNVGSGIHEIEVVARYDENNVSTGTATAESTGAIGGRTLIIEPVKAANDEKVTELAS